MVNFISAGDTATQSDDLTLPPSAEGFPAISLSGFRKTTRMDTTVPDEEALDYLQEAQAWAFGEMVSAIGHELDALVAAVVNAEADYQTAVYTYAKALQLEAWADFDSTAQGNDRAERMAPRIGYTRTRARNAIARVCGKRDCYRVALV